MNGFPSQPSTGCLEDTCPDASRSVRHAACRSRAIGASRARRRRAQRGFTLLELLVVMAILALIATIAGPQVLRWLGGANVDAARAQITALSTTIDLYRLEVGRYPPSLEALIEKPAGEDRWNGPYLKRESIPKDPWNRDYEYKVPGEHGEYDLYSLGADGQDGGDGENADIGNWN
ncbi:MAG: type II secretion system major pseudopilin GspG [Gammaproteobacteria bacterium]|nr:type II secretion system major pseudopilin GspG [Gammaproteobacteria bacterium]